MCSYCKEGNELESECATYYIHDKKLIINYRAYSGDSSFEEEIEIKFCPMCGSELRVE